MRHLSQIRGQFTVLNTLGPGAVVERSNEFITFSYMFMRYNLYPVVQRPVSKARPKRMVWRHALQFVRLSMAIQKEHSASFLSTLPLPFHRHSARLGCISLSHRTGQRRPRGSGGMAGTRVYHELLIRQVK